MLTPLTELEFSAKLWTGNEKGSDLDGSFVCAGVVAALPGLSED